MRQRLRTVRNNMGMSQQTMADMLGISLRYYQRIEAGGCVGSFEIWDALEDITGIHQRILRETDRTEE